MVRITPPDGGAWTNVTLALDRPDSRVLARAILAAGGDATERTLRGGSGSADG